MILTGAGISAESGISTFRDKDGIWAKYDYRDVATPEGFARDPKLVLDFYNMRRRASAIAKPNAAHAALARLEREHPGRVIVITQNVDALHEAAGTRNLIHMHGEHQKALCSGCGTRHPWGPEAPDLTQTLSCPACGASGGMRPDVVWFGEMLPEGVMEEAWRAASECDLMLVVGTSGRVYPAAGLVPVALEAGAWVVVVDPEPTGWSHPRVHPLRGGAAGILPRVVDLLLGGPRAGDATPIS